MYLLSFLAVVVVSLFTIGLTSIGIVGNWNGVYFYLDTWSFAILIILCIPILIGSGLFKDFNNAFRLTVKIKKKSEASLPEVKHAIEAVSLVRKVLIAGGTFIVLLTMVSVLAFFTSDYYGVWGANTAIALLPLVYAFAIDLFLLPVESRLKVRLSDMMHQ